MYTKIMTDVSIFSFLIKGPGGDEETRRAYRAPHENIIVTKIQETQRTQRMI